MFTPKELNNREIIDGIHSTWSYFLDRKLDLPLNSFKTKAAAFCKRATDVVVVELFIVSNSKRMNQCLRYDFADRKI